jgi:PAS domain S-box-containing protein
MHPIEGLADASSHSVQFYQDDRDLAGAAVDFLKEGLAAGDGALVIATAAHRERFVAGLAAAGIAIDELAECGRLRFLDAEDTVGELLLDGVPDRSRFEAQIGAAIDDLAAVLPPGAGLRAYGEMVDLLWRRGQQAAALQLEDLWNDLQKTRSFRLRCAYAMASFFKEPAARAAICGAHSQMVPLRAPPEPAPSLRAEIVERMKIEAALRDSVRELRSKEELLRQNEQRIEAITDALPTLVAYVDAQRRYRFVSAAYQRWFGHPKDQILGRTLGEVLGPDAERAIGPHVERALSGHTANFQAEVPYRDGGPRFIDATYVPQQAPDGRVIGFVSLVADISERKSFERFKEAAGSRAEKLLKVTAAIAGAVTSEQVFAALVDQVAEVIGTSSAGLWLVDDSGTRAELIRSSGYNEATRSSFRSLPLDLSPPVPVLEAIRLGQPLFIPSREALLERYPHLAPALTPNRAYRVACLPLAVHDHVLGGLGLTIESDTESSNDERGFLLVVARYASQAIERVRLFEAERRARAEADRAAERDRQAQARAEQLYRFAAAVVAAEKVEQVFEAALDAIQSAVGAQRASILTFDGDGVMRFRAWRGLSAEYRRAVDGHSPWPRETTAAEPILVPDAAADPELAPYQALFAQEGIGALAFFPLITRGQLLGKFMLYYPARHDFAPDELETARVIANHLASVTARFAAVATLEDSMRAAELFAGVLAHDLRNPLGAMMTAAQLALMRREGEGAGGDRIGKPLGRILSSGQRMTVMIDQLLDFTRARSGGGITIHPEDADLGALCAQAVGELELVHPDWRLVQHARGDLAGRWDPHRLLQVISNLVANAGQHGASEHGVRITLDGTDPERVLLSVHNVGAVPAELLPYLFDPFRNTRHRRDRSQGLGLGLFIVQAIVRAHGGTVEVTSTPADGTTFSIDLPRHRSR